MGGGSSRDRRKFRRAVNRAVKGVVSRPTMETKPRAEAGCEPIKAPKNTHFNFGDSVGVLALIVAAIAMAISPPVSLRILLLAASAFGFLLFFHKSHWTHSWLPFNKISGALAATVLLGLIGIPQIISQWRGENPRPYDLGQGRGEKLLEMLRAPQKEPRDILRIGCVAWSDESCVAAGNFLMVFSEAGWSIEDKKVFREEPGIEGDGVFVVTHTSDEDFKKMQTLPPYLGIWQPMDASYETLFRALNAIGLLPKSSTDQSLPNGTIGIYFGPEPKELRSVTLPPRR